MTFQFPPLDNSKQSLRLITSCNFTKVGAILVEIEDTELPANYTALSYCWGPPGDEVEIQLRCTKTHQDGSLQVRRNLYDFLHHLAQPELCSWQRCMEQEWRAPCIWIDAICIDQCNINERNHQVQQMSSIYMGAAGVIVWLGADQCLGRVFDHFNLYEVETELNNRELRSLTWDLVTFGADDTELATAFYLLMTNPYWWRVWVVQELVLSKAALLVDGDKCVAWDKLAGIPEAVRWGAGQKSRAATSLCTNTVLTSAFFDLYALRKEHKDLQQSIVGEGMQVLHDISRLIPIIRNSESNDFRDKIYGLLGLVKTGANFTVNYSIDIYDLFCTAWTHFRLWETDKEVTKLLAKALNVRGEELNKISNGSRLSPRTVIAHRVQLLGLATRSVRSSPPSSLVRLSMPSSIQSATTSASLAPRMLIDISITRSAHAILVQCPKCHLNFVNKRITKSNSQKHNDHVWCLRSDTGLSAAYHLVFRAIPSGNLRPVAGSLLQRF